MVVAPTVSQLILHNRCFGVIAAAFWQPCREAHGAFDVVVELTSFRHMRVLGKHQVCRSQFDGELCQREVMASVATLSVFKIVTQTLFVLIRALAMVMLSCSAIKTDGVMVVNQKNKRRQLAAWLAKALTPSDQSVTRSILSLLMLGIALGGVAPLIWPGVFVCIHSTMLLWRCCSNQNSRARVGSVLGVRALWFAVVVQVVFGVWFVLANVLSN
eukprot:c17018_g4_i1.p2 GENE.c17018_g4_i1~~c17018_g4_i1.p2  ORF type:complete len:215 (+),score=55.33 c17018_g4_i1:528-1172(+)